MCGTRDFIPEAKRVKCIENSGQEKKQTSEMCLGVNHAGHGLVTLCVMGLKLYISLGSVINIDTVALIVLLVLQVT